MLDLLRGNLGVAPRTYRVAPIRVQPVGFVPMVALNGNSHYWP